MIDWLQKTAGFTNNGLTYDEKKELEELKKEIGVYRDKEALKKGNDSNKSDDE
jgi:hypothetical protein